MELDEILAKLKELGSEENVKGMARVGIRPENNFGVKIPPLRKLGKQIGTDHKLAGILWKAGYRETRILASLVGDVEKITDKQMDSWARDFNHWEICDQTCMNLFHRMKNAPEKAIEWSKTEPEQLKRAGYALMAVYTWKIKDAPEKTLAGFLPEIERGAFDERQPVKKAVSWAVRKVGGKSLELNTNAQELCERLLESDNRHARWVGKDGLRELTREKLIQKLKEM